MMIVRHVIARISVEELCVLLYDRTQAPMFAKSEVTGDGGSITLSLTWEEDTNAESVPSSASSIGGVRR